MIDRMASKYLIAIKFDSRETKAEIKRVLRLMFLDFCETNGINDTIDSYRKYRAVVRSIYGFDIPKNRPRKKLSVVETNLELF